jgi:hypothetical protein
VEDDHSRLKLISFTRSLAVCIRPTLMVNATGVEEQPFSSICLYACNILEIPNPPARTDLFLCRLADARAQGLTLSMQKTCDSMVLYVLFRDGILRQASSQSNLDPRMPLVESCHTWPPKQAAPHHFTSDYKNRDLPFNSCIIKILNPQLFSNQKKNSWQKRSNIQQPVFAGRHRPNY